MSAVYSLVTVAAAPVTVAEAKVYMRLPSSFTTDDTMIQFLIDAATAYGEDYTGRAFRARDWLLLLDALTNPIVLDKDPVDAATVEVFQIISGSFVEIEVGAYPDSTFYTVKRTQCSETFLTDGDSWPTDADTREQAYKVEFSEIVYNQNPGAIETGVMRHTAYMYENRGDCDCGSASVARDTGKESGVTTLYDTFRISRV